MVLSHSCTTVVSTYQCICQLRRGTSVSWCPNGQSSRVFDARQNTNSYSFSLSCPGPASLWLRLLWQLCIPERAGPECGQSRDGDLWHGSCYWTGFIRFHELWPNKLNKWRIKDQLHVTCCFYFTSCVLNIFQTLIYPSSGACDCVVELPHRSFCSQFVMCWRFGAAGFEYLPATRALLKPSHTKSPTHKELRTKRPMW